MLKCLFSCGPVMGTLRFHLLIIAFRFVSKVLQYIGHSLIHVQAATSTNIDLVDSVYELKGI